MLQGGQLSLTGDSSACLAEVFIVPCMPELTGCSREVVVASITAQHSTAQHSTAQHSSVVCAVCQLVVLCPLQWTVLDHIETMQLVVDGSHSALQHSMAHKARHRTL